VRPERALRFLDTLDGAAYAVRLACAGYWGGRLLTGVLAAGLIVGLVATRLSAL
jgi:hypothetical protein